MARRLWRFQWPLAGLAALIVVFACVLVVPQWLVERDLGRRAHDLTAGE